MSTNIVNFICSTIMSIMGLIVVRKISGSGEKIFTLKNFVLTLCLIVLPIFIHDVKYNYIYTIIIYVMTIIIYKYILNISFVKSIISCGIMLISLFFVEFIASVLFASVTTIDNVRNTWYINLLSNVIISIIVISIYKIKIIGNNIILFISKLEQKTSIKIIISIFLSIIAMSTILYTLGKNFSINSVFTTNFIIFTVFFILIIMLLSERGNYEKLLDEYDSLFKYVRVFEDWIETEQLNRHEYKNQLAVLRCMTKERKVKDKIDSIITDYINVDNEMINQLKNLPNGGFKGLLYYKMAVAKNNGIKVELDVSMGAGNILCKFKNEKLKTLSNLIGIYFDNAIEAAKDTKKKIVSLEIYEYDNIIDIVISNTFNQKYNISNRNKKGFSTKGQGRGNGLYFASKLLSKNKWIIDSQEIYKDFYIQKLSITK